MRYITIILLLLVCFFGGMTYGSVETNHALDRNEEQSVKEVETMQMEPFSPEELEVEHNGGLDEDAPAIHQAAAFFERMIVGISTSIIDTLYKTAELFF